MAVYTEITGADFRTILQQYDIGEFVSAKGIAEGVENSNYLLLTSDAPYIATAFEKRIEAADLPFFMGLMEHLAEQGLPCACPMHDRDGAVIREVNGRPFAIVEFLQGSSPARIRPEQCAQLGDMLARMHVAARSFDGVRPNTLGARDLPALYQDMHTAISKNYPAMVSAIEAAVNQINLSWPAELPSGIIHADLFPDNVLFGQQDITGLIDFYFACNDVLMYDVAICLNAWCFERSGEFNITKARNLLNAYHEARPLVEAEWEMLPLLAQGAALRFLLTRLQDVLFPAEGALVATKDPKEYFDKLQFHQKVASYNEYGI